MRSTFIRTTLAVALTMFIYSNNEAINLKADRSAGEKMPRFTYYTLDGKKFSNKNLDQEKSYLFVYFNPLCDLCREETEQIIENMDVLANVQVIMVSPNDKREIEQFVAYYDLSKYPQITVLHDSEDQFYLEFGAIGYPNMFVYDNQLELVAYFDRATDFREIKNAMKPVLSKY